MSGDIVVVEMRVLKDVAGRAAQEWNVLRKLDEAVRQFMRSQRVERLKWDGGQCAEIRRTIPRSIDVLRSRAQDLLATLDDCARARKCLVISIFSTKIHEYLS